MGGGEGSAVPQAPTIRRYLDRPGASTDDVVARRATSQSSEKPDQRGEYPWGLCQAYASRLLDHFEKIAELEYLQGKVQQLTEAHMALPQGRVNLTLGIC